MKKGTQLKDRVTSNGASTKHGLMTIKNMLRVHQWIKNTLLFVPMLTAHQFTSIHTWGLLIAAFFAFNLCASSVYIVNDLIDLEQDKVHPTKRNRPIAAGKVSIGKGAVLALLLFVSSMGIAAWVETHFLECLFFYFVMSSAYSFRIKRILLLDCLTLTVLYTTRIAAGSVVAHVDLSYWLLIFSTFLFLSLALVKRFTECQRYEDQQKLAGRGYVSSDAPLLQMMGVVSGYIAAFVFALYLNSNAILVLYKKPEVLWLAVLIFLYWISSMWIAAHRGSMHDDPVFYAMRDKVSLVCGISLTVVLAIGALGWPF